MRAIHMLQAAAQVLAELLAACARPAETPLQSVHCAKVAVDGRGFFGAWLRRVSRPRDVTLHARGRGVARSHGQSRRPEGRDEAKLHALGEDLARSQVLAGQIDGQ
jgi:plasmid stabilization system protein ParE